MLTPDQPIDVEGECHVTIARCGCLGLSLIMMCLLMIACGTNATQLTQTPRSTAVVTQSTPESRSTSAISPTHVVQTEGTPPAINSLDSPTLRILTPQNGSTISLPATIRYEIAGFPSGLPAGLRLRVQVANVAEPIQLDLTIKRAEGTIQLPNDKRLTGRRDLRFQLIGSAGKPYTNPAASVTVRNLLILGGR